MGKSWLLIALCVLAAALVGCGSERGTVGAPKPPTPQAEATYPPLRATVSTKAPTETPAAVPTPTMVPILRLMSGWVVTAIERNSTEIELLRVRHESGEIWEFVTDGPIGIDAAHLLLHRDTGERVEVGFLDRDGFLIALVVNDLPTR
ncbi:MAG: hypothetical protein BZY83_07710 [SAR202 cluster bacterium Casp-Chloro-G2]|nr:MAG: hypothetical protein BZY83_07710 [SAR202 cluster bacterium Casp-Chloro-G2]